MLREINVLFLFIIGIFLTSCGEDSTSVGVVLPSNFEMNISQSEEDSSYVEVSLSADNVNFFRVDFGDGSSVVEDQDGEFSHTYSDPGEFDILATAHVSSIDYVSLSETVKVPEEEVSLDLPTTGYESAESYDGYELTWSDEFDDDELDESYWTYEIGTGTNGWGNNELQYYTEDNTSIVDGNLIIEAREESKGGMAYTSSRIITKDNFEFQYGRVDIRAVLPEGQGLWPALWMLGANYDEVGWPACGELDMMELVGGDGDNTIYGTVHWSSDGSYASYGGNTSLSSGIFSDEYHVFSIIWDESTIKWLLDDVQYHVIDISPSDLDEFREDFFFIFNVAVGGDWPGSPDSTTEFPQYMAVDYIRVFQLQ